MSRPFSGSFLDFYKFEINCSEKTLFSKADDKIIMSLINANGAKITNSILKNTVPNIFHLRSTVNLDQNVKFIEDLIKEFPNTKTRSDKDDNKNPIYYHAMYTTNTHPLRERVKPLANDKLEYARKEFQSLETEGIIRRSSSPWASPLHMVPKKDGSYRPCGDYRRLNKITVHDAHPMPLINDMLHRLPSAKKFSTLDLKKAYHQIPVKESDIPKTAVITPFCLFEYIRMSFGLRNASQTFQRHIDSIFSTTDFAYAYIDDVIIGSSDLKSHKSHLNKIFNLLHGNNLQLNLEKCNFFKDEVKFLGHMISANGLRSLPSRLKTITEFQKPETISQLRSFLGTITYFHKFIPNISDILSPLSALANGPKLAKVK